MHTFFFFMMWGELWPVWLSSLCRARPELRRGRSIEGCCLEERSTLRDGERISASEHRFPNALHLALLAQRLRLVVMERNELW